MRKQISPEPCATVLLHRVGRVLAEIEARRVLTDREIRQHSMDCARLADAAMTRWNTFGNDSDRAEAALWARRMTEAHQALSPEWKAAREAEIQRAIGVDYFTAQADSHRSG